MIPSPARIAEKKRTFHSLDGLRGIAAILVVMSHYKDLVVPFAPGSAYLAVDAFFLMSGFVIAFAYEVKLERVVSAKQFLVLRIIRLYPLYIAGTLLGALVQMLRRNFTHSTSRTVPDLLTELVPAVLMIPHPKFPSGANPDTVTGMSGGVFYAPQLYPLNGPAWSLFFELVVNVLYAATLRLRHSIFLPTVLIVSSTAMIATAFSRGALIEGWGWPGWWVGLVRVTFSYFMGVLLYRAHRSGRFLRWDISPIVILLAVAVCLWINVPPGWHRAVYDLACVLLIFPALIWFCICSEPAHPRFFSILGLISYPLYVLHIPFRAIFEPTFLRVLHIQASSLAPWSGIGMILFLVAASWFLAATYDVWARRSLGRLLGQRPPTIV
jgi:peptidoglycan/LPS O-acetylase OafA/YrhL